jgi:hypothetical protein
MDSADKIQDAQREPSFQFAQVANDDIVTTGCPGRIAAMSASTCERTVGRWRAVVWLLLGVWIVAHGCHADRDTELSGERGRRAEVTPFSERGDPDHRLTVTP